MFSRRLSKHASIVFLSTIAVALGTTAEAEDPPARPNTYGQVKAFLAKHTDLVELADQKGGRVLVAPAYQGRVMTSTLDGEHGMSFGFICYDFIEKAQNDLRFNNYGGEERLWISPEGGQFSLFFEPGLKQQKLKDWYTPKDINEGAWNVIARGGSVIRMDRKMKLQNTSGTRFDLNVARDVRILSGRDVAKLLGNDVAEILGGDGVKSVAFETVNRITNRGRPWTKRQGLISLWMLGMLNSSPRTVVIVPYRPGDEAELGPVVRADYFGALGPDRLKILPEAILFRADAKYRSKLGTSKRRAVDVLGSIDFHGGVLTFVQFSMPDDVAKQPYMNNIWENPLDEPYDGDVINSYNDGPNDLGSQMGKFYELETLSPAAELKTGETLTHRNRTVHVKADAKTLDRLARRIFGVSLERVRKEMMQRSRG